MVTKSSQGSSTPLRLFEPPFDDDELCTILESFVRSGTIFMGEPVRHMELEVAKYLEMSEPENVVAVSSGTKALEYIFKFPRKRQPSAFRKDEPPVRVLVPGLTMAATPLALEAAGLQPKFVDVGRDLVVNVDVLDEAADHDEDIGAVCVVDYAGRLPDMTAIRRWTADRGMALFEDAAHSFGATRGEVSAMTASTAAATSLHPIKPLPGLGGGLVVSNLDSARFAQEARDRRYYGIVDRDGYHYDIRDWGENAYMGDLSAIVVNYFLDHVDDHNAYRRELAEHYIEGLEESRLGDHFKAPRFDPGSTYHLFPVVVDDNLRRRVVMKELGEAGIATGIHYLPCHQFTRWRDAPRGNIQYFEAVADRLMTLPCHLGMDKCDVDRVLEALALCTWK